MTGKWTVFEIRDALDNKLQEIGINHARYYWIDSWLPKCHDKISFCHAFHLLLMTFYILKQQKLWRIKNWKNSRLWQPLMKFYEEQKCTTPWTPSWSLGRTFCYFSKQERKGHLKRWNRANIYSTKRFLAKFHWRHLDLV